MACTKKEVPQPINLGLEYYPKTIGKFVEYDIDSTVYRDLPLSSTNYKYRIKEKIVSVFTDNEGKEALRIERYIKWHRADKSYDSIPYTIKEVWMANATDKSVEVSEGNIRYTKLIFPIQENAVWNGNARNSLGEWKYTYDYFDRLETIGNLILDKVLQVIQKQDKTLISEQYYTEKYAKGAGLVYREIRDIYSNTVVPGVPLEQRIETGVIYKQTIVNYGYE